MRMDALEEAIRRGYERALTDPVLRWPLALSASPLKMYSKRKLTVITPSTPGLFAHRYRNGVFFYPGLRGPTPFDFQRGTLDVFCWDYEPQDGDVVLDIGAGIGEETLTFSRLVGPTGHVVSVEAAPSTFKRLKLAVEANRLDNVNPIHYAVADPSTMTVRITDSDDAYIEGTICPNEQGTASIGDTTVEVAAVTVDEIVASLGLKHIDLLKMNIEGAEQLAIKGMTRTAEITRHVVISCHNFIPEENPTADKAWFDTFDKVKVFLKDADFTVRTRDPVAGMPWLTYYLYGSH